MQPSKFAMRVKTLELVHAQHDAFPDLLDVCEAAEALLIDAPQQGDMALMMLSMTGTVLSEDNAAYIERYGEKWRALRDAMEKFGRQG